MHSLKTLKPVLLQHPGYREFARESVPVAPAEAPPPRAHVRVEGEARGLIPSSKTLSSRDTLATEPANSAAKPNRRVQVVVFSCDVLESSLRLLAITITNEAHMHDRMSRPSFTSNCSADAPKARLGGMSPATGHPPSGELPR
eukprot:1186260-Prorocentrum_minimum.AAC.2